MMLAAPAIAPPRRTPRTTRLGLLVGAIPLFAVTLLQWVAAPTFFDPMNARRPELLGVPVEAWIMGFALLWGAIGGYIVATNTSRWVLPAVLVVFTLPACLAMILGPAILLILQNPGS